MKFEEAINQACENNINCKQEDCNKFHQRKLAGICILFPAGKCQDKCGLIHYKKNEIKQLNNQEAINGIYHFNICPKINNECQQDCFNCRFLHPKWVIGYCCKEFSGDCEDEKQCTLKHLSWKELKEIVYAQYNNIQKLNPENICCKYDCDCPFHLANTNEICIQYFKGECPNIQCVKKHISWEKYKQNIGEIIQSTKKPCTQVYQQKKQNQQLTMISGDQQIYLKKEYLQQLQKEVEKQNIIDIIFIMDLTGSMKPWKEQIYGNINQIINKFKCYVNNYSLRIAFVGYRDVEIEKNTGMSKNNNHVIYHDLTEETDRIKYFINSNQADGGDDEAEDIIAGLKQAMKLNISRNPESLLITFLFADAPNHGKQYYDQCNDSLSEQVPEGTLEKIMQNYRKMKINNYFSCVTINQSTTKMYQIMKQNFEGLTISETIEPTNMEKYIQLTLKKSFQNSQAKKRELIKATFIKSKYISYECEKDEEKQQFWQQFNNTVRKIVRTGNTSIQIEKESIDQGTQSYIFKLFDTTNNQHMVAKLQKEVVEEYKKNGKLEEATQQQALKYNEYKFLSQSIAKQFGQIYRDKTHKIVGAPPIFYASPIIYTLEKKFYGLDQIYAETYIDLIPTWEKYTNNKVAQKENFQHFQSFSHFTYQESNGQFVVTDLQGKLNILSDPSIQSQTNYSQILNFDETNFIDIGIGEFLFGQHKQCNIICQELKLQREEEQEMNNPINNDKWQFQNSQIVQIICESCDQILDITQDQYKQQLYKQCQNCQQREKEPQRFYCNCCLNLVFESKTQQLLTQTKYEICKDCRSKCIGMTDKCQYCPIHCKLYMQQQSINHQSIYICKDGKEYIRALCCQNCQKRYDNSILLSQEQYETGNYLCNTCKK